LIDVYASMSGQVNGKSVEALNQTNGIGFRTIRFEDRQPDRASEIVATRYENGCPLSAKIRCKC
jgi:hypothetical protein